MTVSLICAHGDICARNVEYAGMVIKAIFHPPVRGISGAMVQALAWRSRGPGSIPGMRNLFLFITFASYFKVFQHAQ